MEIESASESDTELQITECVIIKPQRKRKKKNVFVDEVKEKANTATRKVGGVRPGNGYKYTVEENEGEHGYTVNIIPPVKRAKSEKIPEHMSELEERRMVLQQLEEQRQGQGLVTRQGHALQNGKEGKKECISELEERKMVLQQIEEQRRRKGYDSSQGDTSGEGHVKREHKVGRKECVSELEERNMVLQQIKEQRRGKGVISGQGRGKGHVSSQGHPSGQGHAQLEGKEGTKEFISELEERKMVIQQIKEQRRSKSQDSSQDHSSGHDHANLQDTGGKTKSISESEERNMVLQQIREQEIRKGKKEKNTPANSVVPKVKKLSESKGKQEDSTKSVQLGSGINHHKGTHHFKAPNDLQTKAKSFDFSCHFCCFKYPTEAALRVHVNLNHSANVMPNYYKSNILEGIKPTMKQKQIDTNEAKGKGQVVVRNEGVRNVQTKHAVNKSNILVGVKSLITQKQIVDTNDVKGKGQVVLRNEGVQKVQTKHMVNGIPLQKAGKTDEGLPLQNSGEQAVSVGTKTGLKQKLNPSSIPNKEEDTKSATKTLDNMCNICGIKFNTLTGLESHISLNHVGMGRARPICFICDFDFETYQELNKHYVINHTEIKPQEGSKTKIMQVGDVGSRGADIANKPKPALVSISTERMSVKENNTDEERTSGNRRSVSVQSECELLKQALKDSFPKCSHCYGYFPSAADLDKHYADWHQFPQTAVGIKAEELIETFNNFVTSQKLKAEEGSVRSDQMESNLTEDLGTVEIRPVYTV